jgi:hypothetical protein
VERGRDICTARAGPAEGLFPIGVGITAAIATDRSRRGLDRCIVATARPVTAAAATVFKPSAVAATMGAGDGSGSAPLAAASRSGGGFDCSSNYLSISIHDLTMTKGYRERADQDALVTWRKCLIGQ